MEASPHFRPPLPPALLMIRHSGVTPRRLGRGRSWCHRRALRAGRTTRGARWSPSPSTPHTNSSSCPSSNSSCACATTTICSTCEARFCASRAPQKKVFPAPPCAEEMADSFPVENHKSCWRHCHERFSNHGRSNPQRREARAQLHPGIVQCASDNELYRAAIPTPVYSPSDSISPRRVALFRGPASVPRGAWRCYAP